MSRMLYQLSYAAVMEVSIAYFVCFCQGHQKLYFKENNRYRKKQAALPAAALPFARGTSRFALVASAVADRDWNRTAQTFYEKVCLPFLIVRYCRKYRFSKIPHSCAEAHTYILHKFALQTCD